MRSWSIAILAAALGIASAPAWSAQPDDPPPPAADAPPATDAVPGPAPAETAAVAPPIPDPGAVDAALAANGPPPAGTFRIHSMDVGTGLAVLVEGNDFTLLYDAGSNDDAARGDRNRVLAYLAHVRPDLTALDHLILSHPHKDHSELMPDVVSGPYSVRHLWNSGALNPICSYRALLGHSADEPGLAYHDALGATGPYTATFQAQNCYGKPVPAGTITIVNRTPIAEGVPVPLGAGASMTILHADGSRQPSFNENSVVVRVDLGARRLLLPGDSEAGGRKDPATPPAPNSIEGELIACCADGLRADILVGGHHGSKTSSRTAFLDAVGAAHYIVSAGPKQYSGVTLPDDEVVAEYLRRGIVWRTDLTDHESCPVNPAKIGPDNDGKPGGCDNIRILIGPGGELVADYYRAAD